MPELYGKLTITHEGRTFTQSIESAEALDTPQSTAPPAAADSTRRQSAHSQPAESAEPTADDDEAEERPPLQRSVKNPRVASSSQHHISQDVPPGMSVNASYSLSGTELHD